MVIDMYHQKHECKHMWSTVQIKSLECSTTFKKQMSEFLI